MAIDLSATGPQFFTMNGIIFERRVETFDINIYYQGRRVGTVSSDLQPKIYFDTNLLNLDIFGGFSIYHWHDTLNHAVSVSPIVNAHYAYNRRILQEILDHMNIQDAVMEVEYEDNNMEIVDDNDFDADNYGYFFGNNGIFAQQLIEPLAYY